MERTILVIVAIMDGQTRGHEIETVAGKTVAGKTVVHGFVVSA